MTEQQIAQSNAGSDFGGSTLIEDEEDDAAAGEVAATVGVDVVGVVAAFFFPSPGTTTSVEPG